MRVSKAQKEKTRKALIKAAVDVITMKGFEDATMKEISRTAGVSDATIYNYFSTKERLMFAYFEDKTNAVITDFENSTHIADYTLQEKLHAFIDMYFDATLGDREFVSEVYHLVFQSPISSIVHIQKNRDRLITFIEGLLQEAVEKGQLPDDTGLSLVARLFWDYLIAIEWYWLNDESDCFSATTELIDRSLGVAVPMLEQGLLTKMGDLASFLIKTHMFKWVHAASQFQDTFNKVTTHWRPDR